MNFIFIYKGEDHTLLGKIKEGRWIEKKYIKDQSKLDNLYIARIVQELKGQKAFLIEYEKGEKGYLPYSQCCGRIKPGEEIIVQYYKESKELKFPRFTMKYLLLGNYIQLTPWTDEIRVSRKIKNKEVLEGFDHQKYGFILRSKGVNIPQEKIQEEYESLSNLADRLIQISQFLPIPRELYTQKAGIREFLNENLKKDFFVKTNDIEIYKNLKTRKGLSIHYDENYNPEFDADLQRDRQNLEVENIRIDEESEIIFEETKALTVVDVNHRASKDKLGEKILQTNLNAVFEMAIQMELRDLTGIVIVDCINMNAHMKNRFNEKVFMILTDFPKISFHGITNLNLAQFIRSSIKKVD